MKSSMEMRRALLVLFRHLRPSFLGWLEAVPRLCRVQPAKRLSASQPCQASLAVGKVYPCVTMSIAIKFRAASATSDRTVSLVINRLEQCAPSSSLMN